MQYLDLKYNFKFENCINYFGRLTKSNVCRGKSLVGQVVVGEMSEAICSLFRRSSYSLFLTRTDMSSLK